MDDENDVTDELHDAADTSSDSSGGGSAYSPVDPVEGPVGVDIGTSRIVEYHKEGMRFVKNSVLNAFYSVPYSKLAQGMLDQNNFLYKREGDELLIIGDGAESFANMTNGEVGRPMASGILNPNEKNGPSIIEHIVKNSVEKPRSLGEKLCFSVPAPKRGNEAATVFHEKMIKSYFVSMGYMARGVSEGHLVTLSELQNDSFTGIGISCGAGLCNICLSYFSVPIISFSISKAGDYIDSSTAAAVGEQTNRVRVIKEESLKLVDDPKNRIEKALHIYYEDVIMSLIQNLKEAMEESDQMPKIDSAIPIVLSGGTAAPDGFRDKFDDILRDSDFPIPISEVRLSDDPLTTIAKGAYLAACADHDDEEE